MVPAAQFTGWQWVSLAAGRAGRGLGGLAAAPGRVVRPRPRGRDDGHAGQRGSRRVVRLVGVRAAVRRGGHDRDADVVRVHLRAGQRADPVPGGRRRRHHRGAGRAVPGGPGQGPVGVRAVGPGRAGRQDGRGAARRGRAAGAGRSLAAGDLFVVRPGEKIATDGVVAEGSSAVDASLVTGESMPSEVGPGDQVTGATVNMSGRLVVRATRVGSDTLLAQITRLVSQAQGTKASAQRLADRIAAVFVPCVIALAVATLGFWLGAGLPAAAAWSAAVAVLVVACPCALGLATPTALLAAVGRGAELGILVKSAQALESAGRIRAVVLDKTGTLTTGVMTVHDIVAWCLAAAPEEALRLAGAVEDASEHPIGQAIARFAAERLGSLPPVTGFAALPGAGVRGTVDGRVITVGSPRLFGELSLAVPPSLRQAAEAAEEQGRTAVLAGWDGQARAALVVADQLKPHAGAAVAWVRDLGLRPVLLTGDNSARRAGGRGPARHPGRRRVRRGPAGGEGRGHPPAAGITGWPSLSSATGSTTPPRWPRPTSAWRSAPAPTRPSAPPT